MDGLAWFGLGRGVGGEPGLLVFDELSGLFADIADGFEGQLAREVVDGVFRGLLQVGGPALGGFEELGQGLADVAVVGAVVVEVVVELVGDGGELLHQVVGVLFAARSAWMGVEIEDRLVAGVEELDEDHDAIIGDIGRLAELFDLSIDAADLKGAYSSALLKARSLLVSVYEKLAITNPKLNLSFVYFVVKGRPK